MEYGWEPVIEPDQLIPPSVDMQNPANILPVKSMAIVFTESKNGVLILCQNSAPIAVFAERITPIQINSIRNIFNRIKMRFLSGDDITEVHYNKLEEAVQDNFYIKKPPDPIQNPAVLLSLSP
ncbi:MAG TPA: hypothetical protein DCZ43_11105 [candidate division Zixibacteria bacterium]|nr:hypothetical protein [candidate division Zixibacteria bacterium]